MAHEAEKHYDPVIILLKMFQFYVRQSLIELEPNII